MSDLLARLFADIPPGQQIRLVIERSGYKDEYRMEISAHLGSGTRAPIYVKSGSWTSSHAGSPEAALKLAVEHLAEVRAYRAKGEVAFAEAERQGIDPVSEAYWADK